MSEAIRAILAQGLLGTLPAGALDTLASAGRVVFCAGGTSLMDQGAEGATAYVVLRGRLRILRVAEPDQTPVVVGEVGPGEVVGEMALLTAGRRTATVVAVRDTELLEVEADAFHDVTSTDSTTARQLIRVIVERAMTAQLPRTEPHVITLVLDDEHRAPAVADLVRRGFESLGVGVRLVGRDEESELPSLAREAETTGRLLLVVAGVGDGGWCEAAVRQADVIIPVATIADSQTCELVTDHLRAQPYAPRIEALSIGAVPVPKAAMAPGVRRHRAAERVADTERVARLVLGRSNVLVLGSGSARGLAHVGVVKAFEELGTPVDAIGGTSAGAIVAGMSALGRTADDMRADLIDFIASVQWRRDLTVPVLSLTTGRQLSDAIENYFGDSLIEDVPTSMFAISTDLSAGRAVVHDRGPIWLALRASASIPGIFPPIRDHDRLLADGAIVDRLPVGVMRDLHPDATVISVDVSTPRDLAVTGHADDGRLGRRQALFGRRNRRTSTGIGSLMGRIVELTGTKDDRADITIRPAFDGSGLRNPTQIVDGAIAAGYEATMKTMEAREAELD